MLLILIPVGWLAVLTLLVAVCRIAARADAAPTVAPSEPGGYRRPVGNGLTLWEDLPSPALARRPALQTRVSRREARPQLTGGRTMRRKRRVVAHGAR
jgi:hypothetical protein